MVDPFRDPGRGKFIYSALLEKLREMKMALDNDTRKPSPDDGDNEEEEEADQAMSDK